MVGANDKQAGVLRRTEDGGEDKGREEGEGRIELTTMKRARDAKRKDSERHAEDG